jgi:Fe-S-cluster containining protein
MRPRKEELFIGCSAKTCCEVDTVYISAPEIRRIAGMLSVPPSAFTAAEPAQPDDPEAFALADGPVRLTLAHRAGEPTETGDAADRGPCLFLLRLVDGSGRCGLGSDRPTPCRAFPSVLQGGLVRVAGHSCTCRAWSLADVDPVADRELIELDLAQREEHVAAAAAFNASPIAGDASLDDLLGFLDETG